MIIAPSAGKGLWTRTLLSPRRLLIAAAILHLVVTMIIYGLGRYAVLPGTLDSNGIAISFASDGLGIRDEATRLSDSLVHGQIRDWLFAASPFHAKLYSICFALLGSLFGSTILSAEPLNALCYLAILVLVFKLGQEACDRRSGLIAAATVALWPSLLLHTTQLLRDPLFLVGMLALILVILRLLSRVLSWSHATLTGIIGGLIAAFTWIVRDSFGPMLIATVALGGAMLIVRYFRERHFQAANLVGMTLLVVLSVGATRVIPPFRRHVPKQAVQSGPGKLSVSSGGMTGVASRGTSSIWSRTAAHIGEVRQTFLIITPDASSNIDSNVQLRSVTDIIRYLPRAIMIGFFAPFPNMWLATGDQVGSAGRLLSGLETMIMYLVEGLAVVGLWSVRRGQRRFSVWLLALVAGMGVMSLGLVVINLGTLYRLRYAFLILIIILASVGATHIFGSFKKSPSDGLPDVSPEHNAPKPRISRVNLVGG